MFASNFPGRLGRGKLRRPLHDLQRGHGRARPPSARREGLRRRPPSASTGSDGGDPDMEKERGEADTDAFRAELRSWLSEHLTPEVVAAGRAPAGRGLPRGAARLEPDAGRRRVGGAGLAGRARRARRRRRRAARLPRGDQPGPGAGSGERDRRLQHRPGHHALRHPRAAGPLPRADAARRRDLVAGHVRARRRLGPRLAAHGRGRGRRRLRRQRAEDVELARASRRLVPAVRADGPDGARSTPGITCLLVDLRTPGHRGAAAHDHDRRADLRRALLHRRPRPPLGPARPACTVGGRWP